MMNRENKAFSIFTSVLETLFLAMTGLYLVYRISKSTTFHLVWPTHFERILMCTMAVTAIARLVSAGAIRKKSLAALALTAVYVLVYLNDRYSFLLFMAIFTVGFIDMDYGKILKLYLLAAGFFYGVTLIAGMLGVITNFVTARVGRGIRSAWGMSYYTDFASLGLFLLMTLWAVGKKLSDWSMLLLCVAYMFLSACIAHSNTSTICAALLVLAVFYHRFERRVVEQRKNLRWMLRGPELFATYGFVLMSMVMFRLMLLYARGNNIGNRMNNLLSKRLYYAVQAWRNYGIKPFGTPFQQNGGGFSVIHSNKYNFVDSTYPLILLRYGWVLFLSLCFTWGWTARRVIACRDRRLLLVMGIILIHAFSEHHFIDSHFNILVTMPLAAYPLQPAEEAGGDSVIARRNRRAWMLTALLFAVFAWLTVPTLLSRLKTVLEAMHYGHGEHALRLVCVLAAVLLGIAIAVWATHRVIAALLAGESVQSFQRAMVLLFVCVMAGAGFWFFSGRVIDASVEQNRSMIEEDRKALEIAVKCSAGKVISGVLPAAYSQEIRGMSSSAYFEDDLARLHGATVMLPVDVERGPFIDSGFLYVPISDRHALYTGDRAVVEALTLAGYHPTGYYSSAQMVDMREAARINGLEYDDQTGRVCVEGGSDGMNKGPWRDLYGGRYTVTWQLSLPEDMERSAGSHCALSVTADRGEKALLEKKIKLDRFDEQGRLTVRTSLKVKDSRNVGFNVTGSEGLILNVEKISFVRTPTYDLHTYYDSKLRKTREEYYTLEGDWQKQKEGWFAREFTYDRYGNIEWIRYYDRKNDLALLKANYAQHRRLYNARRQVVREEFYGVNGEPVLCAQGYAAEAREFDRDNNIVVRRYYDVNGELIENSDGYAEVHRVFNDNRQVVREAYFDTGGRPAILSGGYSGIEQTFDKRGNVASKKYLDSDGKPMTLKKKGYAEVRMEYDGQGQLIRSAYFDVDGNPVMVRNGYAAVERDYDDKGNVIEIRYYGPDGSLVINRSGYAVVRREYDEREQKMQEHYFGVDGEPISIKETRD